jgi:hypothetical protein
MTVKEIERTILKRTSAKLAKLSTWFERYDAAQFDRKIRRDAKAGKLGSFAERAIANFRKGRAREL